MDRIQNLIDANNNQYAYSDHNILCGFDFGAEDDSFEHSVIEDTRKWYQFLEVDFEENTNYRQEYQNLLQDYQEVLDELMTFHAEREAAEYEEMDYEEENFEISKCDDTFNHGTIIDIACNQKDCTFDDWDDDECLNCGARNIDHL